MNSPVEDDLMRNAQDLKRGWIIVAALGAAGALARLLISNEEIPWMMWLRRMAAGAIAAVLGYFVVHGRIEPIYEAVFYSFCGSTFPEILSWARRQLKHYLRAGISVDDSGRVHYEENPRRGKGRR